MFSYRLFNKILHHTKSLAQNNSFSTITIDGINSFGSLKLQNTKLPTVISPLDPHQFQNGDKAVIDISQPGLFLEDYFDILYNKEKSLLKICEKHELINEKNDFIVGRLPSLNIQIPLTFGLDIQSSNVYIKETEAHNLKIYSQERCVLGKIKSMNIDIKCGGVLQCQSLLGDGFLKAIVVNIQKIQSNFLTIQGDENINLAAVYVRELDCSSFNGDVKINSCHGSANLKTRSGLISVSSIMGDIRAENETGNIDIIIDETNNFYALTNAGDINVGVSDFVSAFIEAKGKYIDIPEDFLFDGMKHVTSNDFQLFEGKLRDGKACMELYAMKGSVMLKKETLFSKYQLED